MPRLTHGEEVLIRYARLTRIAEVAEKYVFRPNPPSKLQSRKHTAGWVDCGQK